ncbi:Crp/Fnr family transcriptional regulator [Puia dinghuensis]|nr:Crp/Fnr family transcriptional regulator [Puia dinghuensis]
MADLPQYCMYFSPLTDAALHDLLQATETRTYRKGQYLLRKNQTCNHLFFINAGLVKSFFFSGDKQFVMRFFAENVLFSVFDSYTSRAPSNCMLIALESTTVTTIDYDSMAALCQAHHCIETFFRKLLSVATTKMMKRIGEMLEGKATERYNQFAAENGAIMQRISLGDIANYLGITQQSLSRIRAAKHYLPKGK